MRNIIVTTDFSNHSRNSLNCVLDFIQDTHTPCRVLLLNTYVVKQTDPEKVIEVNDELKRKSLQGLETERSEALKKIHNNNITIETSSHMGSLNNVISQIIKRTKIDLVAMGKDGGKNVELVSETLKKQQCPLLVTYLSEKAVS